MSTPAEPVNEGATPEEAAAPAAPVAASASAPSLPPRVAEPGKKRFLGLDAGNWISMTALFISIGTAVWQTSGFVIGPKIGFIAPTSVTFRYWPTGDREALALTATTMNYVNAGRKDYDGLVIDEVASIQFHGRPPLVLHWWWFVGPDGSATEQAHPVVVPGAGLAAHETRFAPLIQPCPAAVHCGEQEAYQNFMPWEHFLALPAGVPEAQPVEIDINFTMTVRERDDRTILHRCRVLIDSRVRAAMVVQRQRLEEYHTKALTPEEILKLREFKEYFSLPCTTVPPASPAG